jgi:periplasmic divalent cation tolerance protein
MENDYVLVLITVPNAEVGEVVARRLLDQKLAACVNFVPGIRSLYLWQGQVNDDAEVLLLVKTRASLFQEKFIPAVQDVHPYDVPEILALPVAMGNAAYLNWIAESTRE